MPLLTPLQQELLTETSEREHISEEEVESIITKDRDHVFEIFNRLHITQYIHFSHPPIEYMEQCYENGWDIDGLNLKSLLIRDKKKHNYYMILIEDSRHIDMKHFKKVTGWKQTTFANDEELWTYCRLLPGSVTPLTLFCDTDNLVTAVAEKQILDASPDTLLSFHPGVNTETVGLRKVDFLKYMAYINHEPVFETSFEEGYVEHHYSKKITSLQ